MKKLKLFLLVCIFCVTFSICDVFASDLSQTIIDARKVTLPDIPEDKLSTYPYYFITYYPSGQYYILYMTKEVFTCDYVNGDTYVLWQYPKNTISSNKKYLSDLSSWGVLGGQSSGITIKNVSSSDVVCTVVYSNFDIKDNTGKTHYLSYEINSSIPEEDDSGFWSSLFNRLTDGFNSLVDGFSNVISKIADVVITVCDAILEIPRLICESLTALFEFLFIPDASRNLTHEVKTLLRSKFNFIFQIKDLISSILDINFYTGTPKFSITYKGSTFDIIDFSIIQPYRSFIRNISAFIMIFTTLLWLLRNAPTLIREGVAQSDCDIETAYIHSINTRR